MDRVQKFQTKIQDESSMQLAKYALSKKYGFLYEWKHGETGDGILSKMFGPIKNGLDAMGYRYLSDEVDDLNAAELANRYAKLVNSNIQDDQNIANDMDHITDPETYKISHFGMSILFATLLVTIIVLIPSFMFVFTPSTLMVQIVGVLSGALLAISAFFVYKDFYAFRAWYGFRKTSKSQ